MKEKFFAIVAIVGILLSSCASDEPLTRQTTPNGKAESRHYRKTVDDALVIADKMFALMDSDAHTRAPRSVASISVIGCNDAVATRSSNAEPDTMMYLVNYEDNRGFALLSSDWRTKPIYAISDEGSLNLDDTTFNKGLAIFMENARADYEYQISGRGPIQIDTINFDPGINRPVIPDFNYDLQVLSDIKPLLKYNPSRWNQIAPFNKYCPVVDGNNCVVGCAAVALAQILSVKGAPNSIGERALDWNLINNADVTNYFSTGMDEVAFLLARLGWSDLLSIRYDIHASGASPERIDSSLGNLGLVSSGLKSYNGSIPDEAYPVVMTAYNSDKSGGHAWVLDGVYHYKVTSDVYIEGYAYYTFEHCVWGWGGTGNGYYSWNSSIGFGTEPHHYADTDDGTSTSQTGDYTRDFKYIYIK